MTFSSAGYRRRRPGRLLALGALVVLLAVAPAYAVAPRVLGYFDDEGERVELDELSGLVRELVAHGPRPLDRERGTMTELELLAVDEVANNGQRVYYKVTYEDGHLCLLRAQFRAGVIQPGTMGCIREGLYASPFPSPERPLTTEVSVEETRDDPGAWLWKVEGLVGAGIATVALVDVQGRSLATEVKGNIYSLGPGLPGREYTQIVAYDAAGKEVYREPIGP